MREKINERMDELQQLMEANVHIEDPVRVTIKIQSLCTFWSVLSEEDKDYIQCCEAAIEDNIEWNVDE